MGKVLILLNGAGLVLNVLVFMIVVHYFEDFEAPAAAESAGASGQPVSRTELEQHTATLKKEIQNLGSKIRLLRNLEKIPDDLGRLRKDVAVIQSELAKLTAVELPEEPIEEPVETAPVETTETPNAESAAPTEN